MTKKLMPGQKVPALKAGLVSGGSFDLSSENPKTFTVIFFYRGFHCPVCKKQLQDLTSKVDEFSRLGAGTIAISMDSLELARQTAESWATGELRIGYNMTAEDAREWGLFVSKGIKDSEPAFFSEPGIFIVRSDRTLYGEYLQSIPFARPRSDDLLAGLKFVLENNYPPRGTVDASVHETA